MDPQVIAAIIGAVIAVGTTVASGVAKATGTERARAETQLLSRKSRAEETKARRTSALAGRRAMLLDQKERARIVHAETFGVQEGRKAEKKSGRNDLANRLNTLANDELSFRSTVMNMFGGR